MKHNTVISKDLTNKKLHVTREFDASAEDVWKAWTEAAILDKWWAPKPWRTETIAMDFSEGGEWFYAMVGPNGERQYSKSAYTQIGPGYTFSYSVNFCDADGNLDTNYPVWHWFNEFETSDAGTLVKVTLTFDEEADLQKIVDSGFETGFTMAHGNLDELLAAG